MSLRDFTMRNLMIWCAAGTLACGAGGAATIGYIRSPAVAPAEPAVATVDPAPPAEPALPPLPRPVPTVPALVAERPTHHAEATLPRLRPPAPRPKQLAHARPHEAPARPKVVVADEADYAPPAPPYRVRYVAPPMVAYYGYAPRYRVPPGYYPAY